MTPHLAALFLPTLFLSAEASVAALSEDEILAGADKRIAEHRQSDLTIVIKDQQRRPVSGATVTVEQTRHEFLFGCNIYMWGRFPDAEREKAYREQFAALLNYATLGFYWGAYEREQGKPQYEYTERVAKWCQEQGIRCKGHPLLWHEVEPAWLPADPAEIKRLSDQRVRDIVSRFKGQIGVWDVVNEAVVVGNVRNKIGAWAKGMGNVAYTANALKIAREANPNATLLVNDFRLDAQYGELLKSLREDGKLLFDVIGMQSHMHGGVWPLPRAWDACEAYAKFGVPLHFTELTVLSGPRTPQGWNATPEGEAAQAEYAEKLYTVLFSHPAVQGITWWDFADAGAWQGAPAGLLRRDLTPKPVYDKLMGLIKGKWWTKAEGRADFAGEFATRAFYGEHRVTVKVPGKRETVEVLRLTRGARKRVDIIMKQ